MCANSGFPLLDQVQDQIQVIFLMKIMGTGFEKAPYGSLWAHINIGRSHKAQYHFQTSPDPKRGHKNSKSTKKLVFCPGEDATKILSFSCFLRYCSQHAGGASQGSSRSACSTQGKQCRRGPGWQPHTWSFEPQRVGTCAAEGLQCFLHLGAFLSSHDHSVFHIVVCSRYIWPCRHFWARLFYAFDFWILSSWKFGLVYQAFQVLDNLHEYATTRFDYYR